MKLLFHIGQTLSRSFLLKLKEAINSFCASVMDAPDWMEFKKWYWSGPMLNNPSL